MKKKLLLILSLLLINSSVFSKKFEGILEINFNDTKNKVCDKLAEYGWSITYDSEDICLFNKDNATYSILDIDTLEVRFKNNKCNYISIAFQEDSFQNVYAYRDKFISVADSIISQNNLIYVKAEESKINGIPCIIGTYIDKDYDYGFSTLFSISKERVRGTISFLSM